MLLYFLIWVLKPISTESVAPQKPENFIHKSNLHYKIDESINDDDFVMMIKLCDDEDMKIRELTKSTDHAHSEVTESGQYDQEFQTIAVESYNEIGVVTQIINEQTRHSPRKRDVAELGMDYNYEYLLNEYFEETLHEAKSNLTYHVTNNDTSETDFLTLIQKLIGIQNKECAEVNVFTVIKSWFIDYKTKEPPLYACGQRLRKIICIWFCVYLVLAIPLWCTRGLCCCCLFCKIFNPEKTIEEAKRYFVANPPGLLKTTKGHEILYEPTKNERDSYEEFEHLIRTIYTVL